MSWIPRLSHKIYQTRKWMWNLKKHLA
jgi:hypothetical protein